MIDAGLGGPNPCRIPRLIMKVRSRRCAFSLLELMAVITMIGVVAAVTMFRLNAIDRKAACETVIKQNVNLLQSAVERYRYEKNVFPAAIDQLVADGYLPTVPAEPEFFKYGYDPSSGVVSYSLR
ncbi:MAG: type II secretion system protein [Planctomycetes bacterium]|nr:type II secretion system protein [Planctomycetota bacterium]